MPDRTRIRFRDRGRDYQALGLPAALRSEIEEAIHSDLPLLIVGESGTGKTHLARVIHDLGPRSGKPFLGQNCAALADGVFETELFGHTRGAFTGAIQARRGLIEAAGAGTLLLDEVAELRATQQAALLDVLGDGLYRPVGSNQVQHATCRAICATNQDLVSRVRARMFRFDLYRRCSAHHLRLPPLRERRDEIPCLVTSILEALMSEAAVDVTVASGRVPVVAPAALRLLGEHPWPGNIRDLELALRRALPRCNGGRIEPEHVHDVLQHLAELADLAVITEATVNDPGQGSADEIVRRGGGEENPKASIRPSGGPGGREGEHPGSVRTRGREQSGGGSLALHHATGSRLAHATTGSGRMSPRGWAWTVITVLLAPIRVNTPAVGAAGCGGAEALADRVFPGMIARCDRKANSERLVGTPLP